MGLALVEVVMEIEEAFALKIPDQQASQMVTVGDVYEFILENTTVPPTAAICLSAVTFYRLRRAARELGQQARLRPHAATKQWLPARQRRSFWARLAQRAQLKLPPLRRPPWLVTICSGIGILLAGLTCLLTYLSLGNPFLAFCAILVAAAGLWFLLARLTLPFAVHPAPGFQTLRGLAETTMGLNFKKLSEQYRGAHENDVWIALRAIIVEQLGVPAEKVVPTATWVKDLGCD